MIFQSRHLILVLLFMVTMFGIGSVVGRHYERGLIESAPPDTVYVEAPPIEVELSKPATIVVTKTVTDTSESAALREEIFCLVSDRDSLEGRLERLLAPHTGKSVVALSSETQDTAALIGISIDYYPMREEFRNLKVFGKIFPPPTQVITNTLFERRPIWVTPALVGGGVTTYHFINRGDQTGALISAGTTLLIYLLFD